MLFFSVRGEEGNTPRRSTEEYWGGDIPWLTPSQLTGEIINEIDKTDEYITKKGFKNSSVKLLPVGTVMLTSRATIGETVINKVPMTTNQGFANIICKDDELFNYFVLYLLRYLTPKLEALAGGSTFLEISRTSVRSLNIPVPQLEEQKKISSILSSVDSKIQKEEEYKAKLERLKKGLMQKLLTGEIRVNTEMEV
jgi:type I restriction enzyme S subunit